MSLTSLLPSIIIVRFRMTLCMAICHFSHAICSYGRRRRRHRLLMNFRELFFYNSLRSGETLTTIKFYRLISDLQSVFLVVERPAKSEPRIIGTALVKLLLNCSYLCSRGRKTDCRLGKSIWNLRICGSFTRLKAFIKSTAQSVH